MQSPNSNALSQFAFYPEEPVCRFWLSHEACGSGGGPFVQHFIQFGVIFLHSEKLALYLVLPIWSDQKPFPNFTMSTGTTLSHEIADTLRSEILRQQYRSGERLPSERDLAARFSASRGAVREALSQLEQLGLISIQPGGVRVKPVDEASIAILGPLMALSEQPDLTLVDQFLQTFAAMSALNAREALTVANDEQLSQMRDMVVALRRKGSSVTESQQEWVKFLEYLAELADNLVVRLIGNDLKAQFVNRMVKQDLKLALKKKAISDVVTALLAGIDERDRDKFGNAVLHYFDELRIAVIQSLNQRMAI